MFGKFCFRVFIGLVVFVALGGKNALGILFGAVVCTGGVGLIVVIPAAYLIGLLCTIWFVPFGSKSAAKAEEPRQDGLESWSEVNKRKATAKRQAEKASSAASALRDYIAASEAKGRSWESIRDQLIGLGWDEKSITLARGQSNTQQEYDF